MAITRKIAIPNVVKQLVATDTLAITRETSPYPQDASANLFAAQGDIGAETSARIAADNAEASARAAAVAAEATARIAADTAEANARAAALAAERVNRLNGDNNEAFARMAADALLVSIASLRTLWEALDFSGLPTSDPGGGKPWLNGSVLSIGSVGVVYAVELEDASGHWQLEDGSGAWDFS